MGCSNSSTTEAKKANPSSAEKNGTKPSDRKDSNSDGIKINVENFIREVKTNIKHDFQFLEKLGSGAFGTVYKAKHKTLGYTRAIKVLSKEALYQQEGDQTFLMEIAILSKLDHPNIIKIFDYYTDEKSYFVVNEMATGGELYDQIVNLQTFSEKFAAIIMKQLLSAVCYLHSKGIVHRDLKPENILMETNTENGDYTIKLIDFGAAISFTKQKLKEVTGTPYYIAPEVLKNSYTNKCDLWSCGVILYILLCGYPPFNADSEDEILLLVERGKYNFDSEEWSSVSRDAKNLVKRLMTMDPNERISAEEALADPWIVNLNKTVAKKEDTKLIKSAFENLKKFTAKQKLQQASIAFIVHQMSTNDHAKELREVFKSMDVSGDGRLTLDELRAGYEKFFKDSSYSESEFEDLMKHLDSDKNGYIEYEEFLRATMKMENVLTNKNLELAFNFFDEDKSGELDPAEIKKALGISGDNHKEGDLIKQLINEMDKNGNGNVDLEEFKELMSKVLEKK